MDTQLNSNWRHVFQLSMRSELQMLFYLQQNNPSFYSYNNNNNNLFTLVWYTSNIIKKNKHGNDYAYCNEI